MVFRNGRRLRILNPDRLLPDSSDQYKDRFPTNEEAALIEDPVERYMALESFSPEQLLGSDLSTSSKEVDRDQAPAGSEVAYTIVIRNSGDTQVLATMVDALPAGLTYTSHERVEIVGVLPADPEFTVDGNKVTWQGDIVGGWLRGDFDQSPY